MSLGALCDDADSGRGRGMWDVGLGALSKSGSLPLPTVFWLVVALKVPPDMVWGEEGSKSVYITGERG